jgi:hypothetical protein
MEAVVETRSSISFRSFRAVTERFLSIPRIPSKTPAAAETRLGEAPTNTSAIRLVPAIEPRKPFNQPTFTPPIPINSQAAPPGETATPPRGEQDSISSQNTVVLPALSPSTLEITFGKKTFLVSETVMIDQKDLEIWESHIRARLKHALFKFPFPREDLYASLTIEFMMVGQSENELRPTIVVGCSSEQLRKDRMRVLKKFKWLAEYKYPCMVIVSPTKYNAKSDTTLNARTFEISTGVDRKEISTLCGIAVRAHLPGTKSSVPAMCTLGGLIMIGDEVYGLTVGHVFETYAEAVVNGDPFQSTERLVKSDESLASDTSESPYVEFDSDSSDEEILSELIQPLPYDMTAMKLRVLLLPGISYPLRLQTPSSLESLARSRAFR